MRTVKDPRRKPSQAHQSVSGIVDLGGMATPPLYPPLAYHPVSDMRSTRNDYLPPQRVVREHRVCPGQEQDSRDISFRDEDTFDDSAHHVQQSPSHPTWTPINDPSARPRKLPLDLGDFSLRNGYTLKNAEMRMNEIFEEESDHVDKKDGLVYHQGHKSHDHDGHGTSYSFVWLYDEPEALPIEVQQWMDKKTKIQRALEGPMLVDNIRRMLETGSALILERTETETSSVDAQECLLPECRPNNTSPPAGNFYITLRPGKQPWQLPKPFQFCLTCFERLWMGNFNENRGPPGIRLRRDSDTDTELPSAHPEPYDHRPDTPLGFVASHAYANELTLDGTMDPLTVDDALQIPSLCSSRHAPPELGSSPLHQVIQDLDDSPRSINSIGDWIIPPNRVQHIAAFIRPGKSLSERETAAVNLWKAASFEQLQWDNHQQKTKYRREYEQGDALVDRSLHKETYQIEDVDGEVVDEAEVEAIVKLPKSRFRGCSLADVWLVMRKEAA